jgi:hypothetical protein
VGVAFVRKGVEQGEDPRVVAKTILHVATVARPRLRYPIGRVANLLITLKRLLPEPAFEQMRRRAFRAEDPGRFSPPPLMASGDPMNRKAG